MTHSQIDYYPSRDDHREPLAAPIDEVTLLEDRAQVRRIARPALGAGHHKLIIEDVSPIIQDVSLRAELIEGRGRVSDIRIRRAIKAKREHQPEDIRAIEDDIRKLDTQWHALEADRQRLMGRAEKIQSILVMSVDEIPEDVAWGADDSAQWGEDLEGLFTTHRELNTRLIDLVAEQQEVRRKHQLAIDERQVMDRPDQHFVAWIEIDLVIDGEASTTVQIDYVVPNALWRPVHSARLDGDVLSFTSKAALWQNTGEDWKDVQLVFSTARSSLGTEPPLLHDDLLQAQRKVEHTTISMREVSIQQAGLGGSKGGGGGGGEGSAETPPAGVELAGVDDGGDIQNLRAEQRVDIPSDGNPNFIELFDFKALAEVERVLAAEINPRVVLRAVQRNTSKMPLLAGPVELLLQGGPVGWTNTLFVAPGERFELGFGPDESVRVVRDTHLISEEINHPDQWTHRTHLVQLFLSNLGEEARTIKVQERVPISEIEKVQIFIIKNKTTQEYEVDDDGIITWHRELAPYLKEVVSMQWRMQTAPDVST